MRPPSGRTDDCKVTIITACRNSGDTIEDTILGVINQNYENVEHIVVDAESTDATEKVLRKYEHKIGRWIRESDSGIADAWNKGIRQATGEIIGINNADDYYTAGTIRMVVDAFGKNPECGFVFGDLKMANGTTGRWYRVFGRPDYERVLRYHMLGLPHPTLFVRKWIYDQVGLFNTGYAIAADYEMVRRIIASGVKGAYLPHILVAMREGGLCERDRVLGAREVMEISTRYGANRAIARIYFYSKRLRAYTGRLLDSLGLSLSTQRWLVHGLKGRCATTPPDR
jgi:glycosyltransferase involved in cell wall biosynthesis